MKGSGSARNSPPARGSAAAPPARFQDGTVTLRLHVQPGARTSGWAGTHGDALRLRLAAPAVDGRANAACIAFLAKALGVPRRAVTIVSGAGARDKVVRAEGVDPARYRAALQAERA